MADLIKLIIESVNVKKIRGESDGGAVLRGFAVRQNDELFSKSS